MVGVHRQTGFCRQIYICVHRLSDGRKEGGGSTFTGLVPTSSPTKHPSPGEASLNRVADVIGEMVLIDQGAAKANAIKRQENIQR